MAMTTPIKEDDSIDYDGLEKLTQFYIDNGITALIAAGTTGYCYTFTPEEHKQIVETIVKTVNKKAFVIAGVSHSGTRSAHHLADLCENVGADALLMTPPYYHQTRSFDGCVKHYAEVAQSHSLPMVIYNTPYANFTVDFFRKCAEYDKIMAIKEASGNFGFARDLLIELGDRFVCIGGGSMQYHLWMHLWGACGSVTSIGNLVPQIEIEFYSYLKNGDIPAAAKIVVEKEHPFFKVMLKYGWHESLHAAMKMFGLPGNKLRLPLVEPPATYQKIMKQELIKMGLLRKKGMC